MSIQGTELTEFGEFEGGEFEGEGLEAEFEGGELGSEFRGAEPEAEFGAGELEAEQFLGDILGSVVGGEMESPLSETQELELASELLEIGSEQELEQFLGNLFRGVSRAVGGFIRSPIGRALGGVLKNVAKRALPVVGGALGSMVAPGIGTALGSKLGSMASGLFEVELEAMPAEAAEFEVARRYVNLAAYAARNAAQARPGQGADPQTIARAAVAAAARTHAPGVYRMMLRTLGGPRAPRIPMGAGGRRAAMPGGSPSRAFADGQAAGYQPRRPGPRRARGYGYPGASGYGDDGRSYGYRPQRRTGTGYGAYGRRRRYGRDYSGWYDPWSLGDGDGDVPDEGVQASGRWIRRGRQIILTGV